MADVVSLSGSSSPRHIAGWFMRSVAILLVSGMPLFSGLLRNGMGSCKRELAIRLLAFVP